MIKITKDETKYVLKNITQRKLRSFLSVLSILVGIAAIFALLSFGIGIQDYVNNLAQESGVDKLFITSPSLGAPGTDNAFALSKDDIDFVSKITGVKEVAGVYLKTAKITSRTEDKYNFIVGIDMDHQRLLIESMSVKLDKGRDLKKGDAEKVVLGYNYQLPNNVFKKPLSLDDILEIDGIPFRVVGFYQKIGNPSDDAQIFITNDEFEKLYPNTKDKYAEILIKADKGVNPSQLADLIKERLRKHKGEEKGKEDFYVQTFQDAIKTFSNIILIINGVLVLIAIVSIIVAFVNIMNTMFTAVLERTKEIGIMKAIGARNSYIMFIFVFEAGIIGLIGGILGILFGFIVSQIGGAAASAAGFDLLKPSYPIWLIIGCLIFATLVGLASGYVPAKRASKLNPVEALRYE